MDKIFLWSFIAYGLTSILTWGSIFEGFREFIKSKSNFLGDLISCTLCTATWVGFFLSFFLGSITSVYFSNNILSFFFDGMFSAGVVWSINTIIEFFEESRIK